MLNIANNRFDGAIGAMKFHYFLFVGAAVLLFAGCERAIELDLPQAGNRLVVISTFSDQAPMSVQVSQGQSVLEASQVNLITFADVEVFADGVFVENLEFSYDEELEIPTYRSSFIPVSDVDYELYVSTPELPDTFGFPNFEPVRSVSRIPAPSPIIVLSVDDLHSHNYAGTDTVQYDFRAGFAFADLAGVKNYYHLKVFQDIHTYTVSGTDTIVTRTRRAQLEFNPVFNDNDFVGSFDGGFLFTDSKFDGLNNFIEFPLSVAIDTGIEKLGKLFFELRTASPEYHKYYTSFNRQIVNPQAPFVEPVILFDNIDEGLGIFAGFSVMLDSVAISR